MAWISFWASAASLASSHVLALARRRDREAVPQATDHLRSVPIASDDLAELLREERRLRAQQVQVHRR